MKNRRIIRILYSAIIILFHGITVAEKNDSEFWFKQSMATIGIPLFTTALMSLTPGGLVAYPPFVLGQLVGMGVVGGSGALYNRPEWMRKNTKALAKTQSLTTSAVFAPAIPIMPVNNRDPISLQPSEVVIGDNIIAMIITGALAAAGYKIYQWYNTPKKDKFVEAQSPAPINK